MIKKLFIPIFLLLSAGCASLPNYDPLISSTQQTFILNEASLNKVSTGMTMDQVHEIMGQEIIIGYAYQQEGAESVAKPLTIANPYKTEEVNTDQGRCTAEFYAISVRQSDGLLTNDELMPLIFCKGVLAYKGWDRIK